MLDVVLTFNNFCERHILLKIFLWLPACVLFFPFILTFVIREELKDNREYARKESLLKIKPTLKTLKSKSLTPKKRVLLLYELAGKYNQLGEDGKSLKYYEKVLQESENVVGFSSNDLSEIYKSIGFIYRNRTFNNLKERDENSFLAIKYLEMHSEIEAQPIVKARIQQTIGDLLIVKGARKQAGARYLSALSLYRMEAIATNDDFGLPRSGGALEVTYSLAKCLSENFEWESCLAILEWYKYLEENRGFKDCPFDNFLMNVDEVIVNTPFLDMLNTASLTIRDYIKIAVKPRELLVVPIISPIGSFAVTLAVDISQEIQGKIVLFDNESLGKTAEYEGPSLRSCIRNASQILHANQEFERRYTPLQAEVVWMVRNSVDYESRFDTETAVAHSLELINESFLLKLREHMSDNYTEVEDVLIIPNGDFHALPIHLLGFPAKGDRSVNIYSLRYHKSLREAHSIQLRLSGYIWRKDQSLSVVDPTMDLPDCILEYAGILNDGQFVESRMLHGLQATALSVLSQSEHANCLHFSCHGQFNWRTPSESGLFMTEESILSIEDLKQIASMPSVELIVLSACETGVGDFLDGESRISISSQLLDSGLSGFISTLWPVDSFATGLLFAKFYEYFGNGDSPSTSLAKSQTWLRSVTVNQVKNYLWKVKSNYTSHVDYDMRKADLVSACIDNRIEELNNGYSSELLFSHEYYWAGFMYYGC